MISNILSSNTLFITYGCSLLSTGYMLLVRNKMLLFRMKGELPLDFMVRFSIFWFISFILAVAFFFTHLYLTRLYLAKIDRDYCVRFGGALLVFGIICAGLAAGVYLARF